MYTYTKLFLLIIVQLFLFETVSAGRIQASDTSQLCTNLILVIDGNIADSCDVAKKLDSLNEGRHVKWKNFLNDSAAMLKYGKKGRKGAIEIKTKYPIKIVTYIRSTQGIQDTVYDNPEIPPYFRGGQMSWINFKKRNLNMAVAAEKGAPAGSYTTLIQFIVDKTGKITEIQSLSNFGFGMEEEVIKMINNSPEWSVGLHAGKPVKALIKLNITFYVTPGS